jgi:hypothetical protein
MTYSFVFVCQAGELEVEAMLLTASLRRHARSDHQLVAAIPVPEARWGRLRAETVCFLRDLGVDIVPITNQIDCDYPIGNKVSCLMVPATNDVTVFVDTDMLCLRAFTEFSEFDASFCAKPADFYTFNGQSGRNSQWDKIYGSFGLPVPATRMRSTVSGELMPPYFNAGFIAVRREAELAKAWLACCRRIDANEDITNKRPWLDQIALPVAVAQLALDYRCLDERFNYPCHVRRIDPSDPPIFGHYHWPTVVLRDRMLRTCCQDLAGEYPPLARALGWYPGWRWLTYPSSMLDVCDSARRAYERIVRATGKAAEPLTRRAGWMPW